MHLYINQACIRIYRVFTQLVMESLSLRRDSQPWDACRYIGLN